MNQGSIPLKKSKIELRRSPLALKIILTVLILFSMAALIALSWVHQDIRAQVAELKEQAVQVEHRNAKLEQRTKNAGSVSTIQEIAQEELGLVDPNTVVIRPEENPQPSETSPDVTQSAP